MNRTIAMMLVGLAACDAQVGGDYRGEPLATLRGELNSRLAAPVADGARMAVVWDAPTDVFTVPQRTELVAHGALTSRLSGDVLDAPPADAFQEITLVGGTKS